MITKQYSVRLKEELRMVLVDNSDACDNAIKLRTDILNTNASLMSSPDKIKNSLKKLTSTTYLSNSAVIKATDIVVDGIAYFYKYKKLDIVGHTATYSKPIVEDEIFVYSNDPEQYVVYYDADGNAAFSMDISMYPVFIDKRITSLKSIWIIDNKSYIIKRKTEGLLITFSEEPQQVLSEDTIFNANAEVTNDFTNIYLNEFVWSTALKFDGINTTVSYDYFPFNYNLIKKFVEEHKVSLDGLVELGNRNVDIGSVRIVKKNSVPTSIGIWDYASHNLGKVFLSKLIQDGTLVIDDVIEIEYSYLYIDKPILQIDNRKLDRDCKIHTYVSPTKITTGGVKTVSEKNLSALITRKDFIIDLQLPLASINIAQTGAFYDYDYRIQSPISFIDSFALSEFYTSNIEEVDTHLDSKLYRSVGNFQINKGTSALIDIFKPAATKEDFKDYQVYKYFSNGIVVLNGETTTSAGVLSIEDYFTYPINFNIDHETVDKTYLKIDVSNFLGDISALISIDAGLLQFAEDADLIGKDFRYTLNNIGICSVNNGIQIDNTTTMFLDAAEKVIYAKIDKQEDTKLFVKYQGMISQYGIKV
jgi:hypothetical protein